MAKVVYFCLFFRIFNVNGSFQAQNIRIFPETADLTTANRSDQ
jgi:hypothetical protein